MQHSKINQIYCPRRRKATAEKGKVTKLYKRTRKLYIGISISTHVKQTNLILNEGVTKLTVNSVSISMPYMGWAISILSYYCNIISQSLSVESHNMSLCNDLSAIYDEITSEIKYAISLLPR